MQPINGNNGESLNSLSITDAGLAKTSFNSEACHAEGRYHCVCLDKDGNVKWEDDIDNVVCTAGKNTALDAILAGSSYTAAVYMGLAGSGASAALAADTMSSHSTWLEVGGANLPTYTSPRKTPGWSSASAGAKATSSAVSFPITGSGTVGGCFLVYGPSAVTTLDSTTGVLLSCGAFLGGSKTVANGDTLNVTYTLSL